MKKLLTLLLTLMISFSSCLLTVKADDEEHVEDNDDPTTTIVDPVVDEDDNIQSTDTEIVENEETEDNFDVEIIDGNDVNSKMLIDSNNESEDNELLTTSNSEYVLTFDANGGLVVGDNWNYVNKYSISVFYNQTFYSVLPRPCYKYGYTLVGWFTKADGGEEISETTKITENTTIYAHWEPKNLGNGYTGFIYEDDGNGYYYKSGVFQPTEYGFIDYDDNKFLVVRGVKVKQDGLFQDPNNISDWYYLSNGQVLKYYTGLASYDGAWFYVSKGKLDTTVSGFIPFDGGLFYVGAGKIMRGVDGLAMDPNDNTVWYFLANGEAQIQYTGLALYNGQWFYVEDGRFMINYNGIVLYNNSYFSIVTGMSKGNVSSDYMEKQTANNSSNEYISVNRITMLQPGKTFTIGEEVRVIIEAEFVNKPSNLSISFATDDGGYLLVGLNYTEYIGDNKYLLKGDISEYNTPGEYLAYRYDIIDKNNNHFTNNALDSSYLYFKIDEYSEYKILESVTENIFVYRNSSFPCEDCFYKVKYSDLSIANQKDTRKDNDGYAYVTGGDSFTVYEMEKDKNGDLWGRIQYDYWVQLERDGKSLVSQI